MKNRNICYDPTRRTVLSAAFAAFAGASLGFGQQTEGAPPRRSIPMMPQELPGGFKMNMRNTTDDPRFITPSEPVNSPLGAGKGIHPGRVVWAHDPKVAKWDGETGNWWDEEATDQQLVQAMISSSLQSLTGEKSDKAAWQSLFRHFNHVRRLKDAGYRPGEKIAIKLNSNQDRPGAWRMGSGMPTPQVAYALAHQLINEAGVPGEDITFFDASKYVGDPIYNRIRANQNPAFQAVRFLVAGRMAGNGRLEALPDKNSPIRFSKPGLPTAYPPQCVTEAKYFMNVALGRAHTLMGITAAAKNMFGCIYFDGVGFVPRPVHDYAARDVALGSYNCLTDLIACKHLGGKALLNLVDLLYVAESQNTRVTKWQSFGNHWTSSLFLSQDPVAIDSVVLDFVRNEPTANECRGKPEVYMHEAALAEKAPSGIRYDPTQDGAPAASLGVHEHWNNADEKKYSRNLGKRQGIELVQLSKA